MKRVKLVLSFDGTRLHGFQVQKNAPTVQGELNRALETLFGGPVAVCGCSRTDAGVHARVFHAHADLPDDGVSETTLVKSLNALLPDDIAVCSASPVPETYHARYSVIEKTYRYYFWNDPVRNPLYRNRALTLRFPLDLERVSKEAETICGTHDFKSFQSSGGKELESTVRTVSECRLDMHDFPLCYLSITADGFLYHMVRNLTGTLIRIGRGKEPRTISELIRAPIKPSLYCAPACGLYLWDVCDREN